MIPEPKLYASLLKDGRIRANDFISLATMELMFGTPKQGMRKSHTSLGSSRCGS